MQYAPVTELGVVFLFASLCHKLGVRVEAIRPQFPDCIVYQKQANGERRLRIEFELHSRHFKTHGHSPRGCDWIVCWEHDWPEVPKNITVVELRAFFGKQQKVWIQPVIRSQQYHLTHERLCWGLSKRATPGDILLMYRCLPVKAITDIYSLRGPLALGRAEWRDGQCYGGDIRKVCHLGSPIFLDDMRRHPVLKTASFIRCNMQGNLNVTEYKHWLLDLVVRRNPSAAAALKRIAVPGGAKPAW